jgi:hypothetical protein
MRLSGSGFTGNGCVGQVASPGTSLCGTGRSSIPKIGSPVTRSKMKSSDILVITATAGTVRPFRRTSMSVGAAGMSQSQMSWCTSCWNHFNCPVFASSATTELP